MALPAPDMESCCEKRRCLSGVNAGQVYDTCDPCRGQGQLDRAACDCIGTYFYEIAWYKLDSEFQRNPDSDCAEQYTYYTTGGKLVAASVSGLTGVVDQGLSWTILEADPVCETQGTGACPNTDGRNLEGFVVFPSGLAGPAVKLDQAICYGTGANDTFRQTIFTTGVVTGYGNTDNEALCNAKEKEPLLNVYPTCS